MTEPTTLLLVTTRYPYGHGEEFLETEIKYLAREFDTVIVAPSETSDAMREIPANVELDLSLANLLSKMRDMCSHAILGTTFRSLALAITGLRDFRLSRKPYTFLYQTLRAAFRAGLAQHWLEKRPSQEQVSLLIYCYWLNEIALGLALASRTQGGPKVICRAHRHDLYEEEMPAGKRPLHTLFEENIDAIFAVSESGLESLKKQFPALEESLTLSRLGVEDPESRGLRIPHTREPGTSRLVSCSTLSPVKRLPLLLAALKHLGDRFPTNRFDWHHFGGNGSSLDALKQEALETLPSNVVPHCHGQLSNRQVLDFYSSNHVDVFVNVSSSEGIPVSIMEAMSFGIPVVATDVGGTREAVVPGSGLLLSPNPSFQEVATALAEHLVAPNVWQEMRACARKTWAARYDAAKNYPTFAKQLKSLAVS